MNKTGKPSPPNMISAEIISNIGMWNWNPIKFVENKLKPALQNAETEWNKALNIVELIECDWLWRKNESN